VTHTWQLAAPEDLTARQLHDALLLRHLVFVEEQDCPGWRDIDGRDLDEGTRHLLGQRRDGALVAYARLLPPGDDGHAVIGRIVVAEAARGTGTGHDLVDRAVDACASLWPGTTVRIEAQDRLRAFYVGHGFEPVSEVYVEDDIPHVTMLRRAG
jgi:ElaA protein